MNAQGAIEKVLQEFTRELLKVFSESVLQAVSQVSDAGRAALPAATAVAIEAARRAPRKVSPKASPKASKKPAAKASPKGRTRSTARPRRGASKSTPEQVNELTHRILDALRKSSRNLGSKELVAVAGLRAIDEGRFEYALGKLKESGDVQQHGERRQARYGLGAGAKPKAPRASRARAAAGSVEVSVEAPAAPAEA